ncbi:30S ribosomal protein S5 [Candidatus Pacearchaeota archaeon CG10_big_fil_rev_8_21_14_0_10_31_24]|nr:MAG: 30S ribosomal protein S5 [Candidatus Pacearchaeota archaeon CG10_big_fil_rev_8_21_14_0_10_31_24]
MTDKTKDIIEAVPEEIEKLEKEQEKIIEKEESPTPRRRFFERDPAVERQRELEAWIPKTELGKLVKAGKEKDIDKLISAKRKVLEPEIFDTLLNLDTDLLLIGQAKGKFGGGKRRAWRQTQRKTKEGNVVTFSAMAVAGDKKDHIGVGYGKAKETLPARAKAIRQAKLNVIKITRGYESKEDHTSEPHTVPFVVEGKCGSVRLKLIPAPRGTGLVVGNELKKILKLAGIQDVYGASKGQTRTTFNVAKACIDALKKTNEMKL